MISNDTIYTSSSIRKHVDDDSFDLKSSKVDLSKLKDERDAY